MAPLVPASRDEEDGDEKLRQYEAFSVFWGGMIEVDISARSFLGSSRNKSVIDSENNSACEDIRQQQSQILDDSSPPEFPVFDHLVVCGPVVVRTDSEDSVGDVSGS